MNKDYEQRISKLELDNKYLIIQIFHLMNMTNPTSNNNTMKYFDRQIRKNINLNNNNINRNIHHICDIKPNISLSKYKENNNSFKSSNDKNDENKENNINNNDIYDFVHDSNNMSEKEKNLLLNKKRERPQKNSDSSYKNNSLATNKKNNNGLLLESNNNLDNADNII